MNGNDLIKFFTKLKFSKEEEKVQTFAYAKLEDDTVIQSEEFVVGNPIVKVLEDGTTEPLADGEYIIKIEGEEGEILKKVIIVEGIIDSIEDVVEPETEPEMEPETKPEVEVEEEMLVAKIASLEERIAKLEEMLNPTEMEEEEVKVEEKEEELEKLDGAPVEKFTKITIKNKIETKQDKFLSKLYR